MALAMATIMLPQHSSGQSEAPSQDRVTEAEMGPETEGTATPEAGMETDMVFRSSDNLALTQTTTDDTFAAGNLIEVDGAEADHLFLAGSDIVVANASVHDLIAAGGDLRLTGAQIIDDIIVAGGDIVVGSDVEIGGSAVLAGGTVRMDAPVGGDLRVMAGDMTINSTVAGTARLSGTTIVVGPDARIAGDLLYRGDDLTVQRGAVIEGRRLIMPEPEYSAAEDFGTGMGRFALFLFLSIVVSYLALVFLLALSAPRLMYNTANTMWDRPWQSLGIGVLYAIIVPLLVMLLAWSGVGLPLAFLLVVVSLALTAIAFAATAYFTGMGIRRVATGTDEAPDRLAARIGWPIAGALIIFALTMIPLVGFFVWVLAMVFGLGAFAKNVGRALIAPAAA